MNIRRAEIIDADVIIEFNCAMAWETEQIELDPAVIRSGVLALFQNPDRGHYLVAEYDGAVAASLMITTEWSDWRNGAFWWIQSVYVRPEYRRQGIFRAMYEHLSRIVADDPTVCGFRLYVEQENERAKSTYVAMGMTEKPYRIFEDLKPGVHFLSESRS